MMPLNVAHKLIVAPFSPVVDNQQPLAMWYAQGHSDRLGDRLLMFDNTSAPSWEILRFKPALSDAPGFGEALREQVERLRSFQHPAFSLVRPVNELDDGNGLAVVSTHVAGVRLSEALQKPRSVAFAVRLIRQLTPALVALHRHAPGIAHGALDADRIVVTPEGQLTIREHMVGSAIESLGLSAKRLWTELGILAPPMSAAVTTLDEQNDVMQLALIALSLMAGRRIEPDDYPERLEELLDEMASRTSRQTLMVFLPLRHWLERALRLGNTAFTSSLDANDALAELWDESRQANIRSVLLGPAPTRALPEADVRNDTTEAWQHRPLTDLTVLDHAQLSDDVHVTLPDMDESEADDESGIDVAAGRFAFFAAGEPFAFIRSHLAGGMKWAAVAIALLAAAEAVYIGRLLTGRDQPPASADAPLLIESPQPGAAILVDDKPAGVTPLQLTVGPQTRSIRVLPPASAEHGDRAERPPSGDQKQPPVNAAKAPVATVGAAAAAPRSGGFRVSSPVELHVVSGERVLGSTADGPIVAAAGRHEFEFVNSLIGYRVRQVVNVRPGVITQLTITPPNGIVHINAVPWAAVWIDGNPVGETPLGNLSVRPGEHEVVFRHPELGEQRQKAIVRTDVPTRISANMRR
jgi:hypothetical protein